MPLTLLLCSPWKPARHQISAAVAISAGTVICVTLPVAAQVMFTVRSCAVGFQIVTASVPSSACQPFT